jgi:hypothetical protein
MPVSCSVSIAKLSTAELRELDYRVMRHAFDSQNELGRLADIAHLVALSRSRINIARHEVTFTTIPGHR